MIFTCDACGQPFDRAPAHVARSTRGVFCSRECFGRTERAEANPGWAGGLVELTCPQCDRQFACKRGEAARRRYCSYHCRGQAQREARRRECPTCLASFIPRSRERFCSRACAGVVHRTAIRGSRNGRYVDGGSVTRYTPGFTAAFRRSIVARDRGKCVVCQAAGCVLQVHHIDGSKDNHAPTNLVTLCLSCHARVHTKRGINVRWMSHHGSLLFAASQRPMPSTTSRSSPTTTTTPTAT